MARIVVVGHKNPDTDSIGSAIAYADLKRKLGFDAEPVRLGDVNPESEYALRHFGIEAPQRMDSVAVEGVDVVLVDHNERPQSADDIAAAHVVEVIDHHRIANFETKEPIYVRNEPVGCTSTILLKLFKERSVPISRETAGMMLSAIISDTLLLRSATCTDEDVEAVRELAAIAGVDPQVAGMELLRAGTALSGKTAEQLITMDAKPFQMAGSDVSIAQVSAIDPQDVMSRKSEIEAAMDRAIEEQGLGLFLFMVVDIVNTDSVVIAKGRLTEAVEHAFGVRLVDNTARLPGVASRKKQVVPVLQDAVTALAR
jgi:manganese-dependent inorganic pyrophosphatase